MWDLKTLKNLNIFGHTFEIFLLQVDNFLWSAVGYPKLGHERYSGGHEQQRAWSHNLKVTLDILELLMKGKKSDLRCFWWYSFNKSCLVAKALLF